MNKDFKTYELELINGEVAKINENDRYKALMSTDYNFLFDKLSGDFYRWGKGDYTKTKTKVDPDEMKVYLIWCYVWDTKFDLKEFVCDLDTDGSLSVTAPEILDWEISERCGQGCGFCYKANNVNGKNLSFDDFKETFHKLPKSITTTAFGIGDIALQPDLFKILNYTRDNGIIPTITINGNATDEELDKLVDVVGACAVSVYDKNVSYNAIKGLTDRGLKQVNIHYMICEETYDEAFNIIDDIKNDPRLAKLNALVFLSLKEKGRSVGKYNSLSQEKFDKLFQHAIDSEIGIGFDSCSGGKCFDFIDRHPQYEYMREYIDPCESTLYSAYLNTLSDPKFFPCSFIENTDEWKEGLSVNKDFMEDIWFNKNTSDFRLDVSKCRSCNQGCPVYNV